jgi:hypothetical protein
VAVIYKNDDNMADLPTEIIDSTKLPSREQVRKLFRQRAQASTSGIPSQAQTEDIIAKYSREGVKLPDYQQQEELAARLMRDEETLSEGGERLPDPLPGVATADITSNLSSASSEEINPGILVPRADKPPALISIEAAPAMIVKGRTRPADSEQATRAEERNEKDTDAHPRDDEIKLLTERVSNLETRLVSVEKQLMDALNVIRMDQRPRVGTVIPSPIQLPLRVAEVMQRPPDTEQKQASKEAPRVVGKKRGKESVF